MSRMMRTAAFAFATLLSLACLAEEKVPWEALGLEKATLDGRTFYFEKALESKLDVFREKYKAFLTKSGEEGSQSKELLGKAEEIMAEVYRLLGASEKDIPKEQLGELLGIFLGKSAFFFEAVQEATVYVARQETIKDYLRKGGELPCFGYDKESDTASFRFEMVFRSESPNEKLPPNLPFPVKSSEQFEEDISPEFEALSRLIRLKAGVAFHELAETTILSRLRAPDPYFRWFSDGFANAIARRMVEKHVGQKVAKEFVDGYDTSKHADLEKEVNLYYWMGLAFSIKTPLESESDLDSARYAYATFEAERLVEKHGVEVVKKILDKACERPTRDSRNLVAAIKEITGEDVEERFKRYQTFTTREEGIKKYVTGFNEAMKQKDYGGALTNLLRIQEVRGPDLRDYSNAAYLLFRMGHEELGDKAIKDHLELLEDRGLEEMHLVVQKLFIEYAFKCGNAAKVQEIAEAVLEKDPDFVPALAIRIGRLGQAGKIAEAKEAARRVLELDKNPDSSLRKLAEKVLNIREKK